MYFFRSLRRDEVGGFADLFSVRVDDNNDDNIGIDKRIFLLKCIFTHY